MIRNKIPVLIGVILLVLLFSPVSATLVPFLPPYQGEVQYTDTQALLYNSALEGLTISNTYVNIVPGSDIAVNLVFDDTTTKTGRIQYDLANYGLTDSLTLTLDGDTKTRTGPHVPGVDPSIRIGYMCENNTDFLLLMCDTLQYAQLDEPQVFSNAGSPVDNPIIEMSLVSTSQPFSAQIRVSTLAELAQAEEEWETGHSSLIDWLIANYIAIWNLMLLLWEIFRFFFIDNLLLVMALIEMGIIAYRLSTAQNVFLAFSFIISDNERLIIGIMNFLKVLVSVIWDIINFINPMRWILGK